MPLFYSPEYELKLKYDSSNPRLNTPTGLSVDNHDLWFSKVTGATSYSVFIDNILLDTVTLAGTSNSFWLFNELISIDDNDSIEYNVSFVCDNGITYSSLKIYGRNTAPGNTGKFAIYYDSTKVFEEQTTADSMWLQQEYREIHFSSTPSSSLLTFLESAAEELPEQLCVDLSTLTGWSSLDDGNHIVQLVARANNVLSSFLSHAVNIYKNDIIVAGRIYGPYTVVRVVDGDTVVANINGAEQKIRMIGVNTPESVASSAYGTENCQQGIDASNYTKAQLTGNSIYIEFDTDIYDRYNRYLCYIYRDAQGTQMYNAELISEGYGEAQYYSPNGAHRTFLESTQATARANGVRNWGTQFFPTKLDPPVITLSGSVITWAKHPYAASYDIRSNSAIVTNFVQPSSGSQNELDLASLSLSSGNNKINIRAKPTNSTHKESNLSNNVTFVV